MDASLQYQNRGRVASSRRSAITTLHTMVFCILSLLCWRLQSAHSFSLHQSIQTLPSYRRSISITPIKPSTTVRRMSTTVAPDETYTEERTKRKQGGNNDDESGISKYNDEPLEYLEDEMASRDPEDPFHILLLDSTFAKPKITLAYVAGCLNYVLDMPHEDAVELCNMAQVNGMSCLGTWSREECLSLGRDLQIRDVVVRVVPFCEGGNRGWQAKDSNGSFSSSNSGSGSGSGGDYGASSFYSNSGFD